MLEEVIMSDRHTSHGQMYSFLQLFFNTEKIEGCNRLRVAYIHCNTALINNEPLKIYVHPTWNTKKKSCSLTEYCFSFWRKISLFDWGYWRVTPNGVLKWHRIKGHLSLRISELCWVDNFVRQS